MNQDFTVQKKQYLSEKKFVQRGSPEKNSCTGSERKKKFVQAENSPPRITFLMVRPLDRVMRAYISSLEIISLTYFSS